MQITHATAHHLQREADSQAKLVLRKDELSIDEQKEVLLVNLKKSFTARLSRQHGSFSTESDSSLLENELLMFLKDEHSISVLSTELMKQLEQQVNNKGIELNSHFLFFEEKSKSQHFFYLFVANQCESLAIDESLDVTSHCYIDTGASLSGVKIDITEWQKKRKYPYLTQVPPKGNVLLSEIMYQLSRFSNCVDKVEATHTFLAGVESFAKHVPEGKVEEYRDKVVSYCIEQEQKDEPINIPGLSKELNGIDCDKFVREMLSHNPKNEEEVMIDRRSLKKYATFSGREKNLAISFSSFQLNDRVIYDEVSDTLSIKGLPKMLRNQLVKHLKQS